MTSVKKNYIYNIIYEMLVMILPLITLPYLSRTIGPVGSGVYSYIHSIANYFLLFSNLGLNNYGNRSIAKVRDDKDKLSKTFKSIYCFQIIYSFLITIIYLFFSIFILKSNKNIAIIFSLFVLSGAFNINWLLYGLEKFKITLSRNLIIKISSAILIFKFVKGSNDVWIYCLITALSTLISQLSVWPIIVKQINFNVKVSKKDVLRHIKPLLILFIPVIATSIYRNMDKIMLANMTKMSFVGQYEYADKIITFPTTIITALGFVLIPKISNLLSNGKKEESIKYLNLSMEFSIFLAVAFSFGLISVSDNFIPLFLGKQYQISGVILQILAPSIIFIAVGNTIKTQYLIPNERDKEFVISVILGAIINLAFNFLLIPNYYAYGAAFATLLAEIVVGMYQILSIKKEINFSLYMKMLAKYLFFGFVMLVIVNLLRLLITNSILLIGLQILLGALIYALLTMNFWRRFVKFKKVKNKSNNKINCDGEIPILDKDMIVSEFVNNDLFIINDNIELSSMQKISKMIREDNSIIRKIDFSLVDEDILDIILDETKIYGFKFNNDDFLRHGKYPKVLSNSYKFMRYVIDMDINNLAYIDIYSVDDDEYLRKIINYTFRKLYYLRKNGNNIMFDLKGTFMYMDIMNDKYFSECLRYIMNDKIKM